MPLADLNETHSGGSVLLIWQVKNILGCRQKAQTGKCKGSAQRNCKIDSSFKLMVILIFLV